MTRAADGLKLLTAWARYEDELPPEGPRRQNARVARGFLSQDE